MASDSKNKGINNLTNAGKGRKKGAKNKLTTNIKTAFLKAFEDLGGGDGLAEWGMKPQNRGDFYKMIAKMLPAQIIFDEESPLLINITKQIVRSDEVKGGG